MKRTTYCYKYKAYQANESISNEHKSYIAWIYKWNVLGIHWTKQIEFCESWILQTNYEAQKMIKNFKNAKSQKNIIVVGFMIGTRCILENVSKAPIDNCT